MIPAQASLRAGVEGRWPADSGREIVPRGVSKQKARVDLWLKYLAPSAELREWYGHEPARWPQFRKRYRAELRDKRDVLALLKYVTKERVVTFVYGASDEQRNSAVVLKAAVK
jgi:uncharacterized protein YeaO (DUF488 family)